MADEVVEIISSGDENENFNGAASGQYEDDVALVKPSVSQENHGKKQILLPWSLSSTCKNKRPEVNDFNHSSCPEPKIKGCVIVSSSRQEIKSIIRSSTQVCMSKFVCETPSNKRKRDFDASGEHYSSVKRQRVNDKTEAAFSSQQDDDIQCVTIDPCDTKESFSSYNKEEHLKTLGSSEENESLKCQEESNASKASVLQFIKKWTSLKGMLDQNDKKIEDKIWKYYYLAHTSFTHSQTFLNNLEVAVRRMNENNVYVLIKDFLDCMKSYKDVPFKEPSSSDVQGSETADQLQPDTAEDAAVQKKLRKIEKAMKKLDEQIRQLDEVEVDLDDEDNSAYLVQERLKMQFMKLDDYYCKLAGCSRSTGRPVEKRFRYEGSRYPEINQRISAWINKHREFPDYHDVLNLVKKVTDDSALPLRPETVRVQAQEIFRDVGKMLKERRENDDLYSIYSYCNTDVPDPATQDPELASVLDENARVASEKLVKVFQKYVDKESQQREISDKKADAKKSTSDDETTERESRQDSDDCGVKPKKSPREHKSFVENSEGVGGFNIDSPQPKKLSPKKHSNGDCDNEPYQPIVQQEIVFDDGRGNDGSNRWASHESDDEETDIFQDDAGDESEEADDVSECGSLPDINLESDDACDSDGPCENTERKSKLDISNQSILKCTPATVSETEHDVATGDDVSPNAATSFGFVNTIKDNTMRDTELKDELSRHERTNVSSSENISMENNVQGNTDGRVNFDQSDHNSKSNGLLVRDDVRYEIDDESLDSDVEKNTCRTPEVCPPHSSFVEQNISPSLGKLISPGSKKRVVESDKLLACNSICAAEKSCDKLPLNQASEDISVEKNLFNSSSTLNDGDLVKEKISKPGAVSGDSNSTLDVPSGDAEKITPRRPAEDNRNRSTDSDPVSDPELSVVTCHLTSVESTSSDIHNSVSDVHNESKIGVSACPQSRERTNDLIPDYEGQEFHAEKLQLIEVKNTSSSSPLCKLSDKNHANSLDHSSIASPSHTRVETSEVQDVQIASGSQTSFRPSKTASKSIRTEVSLSSCTPIRNRNTRHVTTYDEEVETLVTLEPSTDSDYEAGASDFRNSPSILPHSSHSFSTDEVMICEEDTKPLLGRNLGVISDTSNAERSPSWMQKQSRRNKLRAVYPIIPVPNGRHHQPSSPELVEID